MNRLLTGLYTDWTEGRRSPGLLCFGALARPASWFYRIGVALDQRRHQRPLRRMEQVRLIVVSSPLVGGTGKSPMAAWLAGGFLACGDRTAIVTTGYGRSAVGRCTVDGSAALSLVTSAGDEAVMLNQQTGASVWVDDDPAAVIADLDRSGAWDVIVFDDGVSRRWQGERRIVVMATHDLESPVRYLPYGRWRVGPPCLSGLAALAIVDVDAPTAATAEHHRSVLRRWGYEGPVGWYVTVADGLMPVSVAGAQPVEEIPPGPPFAFCGLGRPGRFAAQLARLGVDPGELMRFPDHHAYTRSDWDAITQRCEENHGTWMLTTHKDAVKIDPAWPGSIPLYYLRITLKPVAGDDLFGIVAGPA